MNKTYTPGEVEEKWYKSWEDEGYFHASYKEGHPIFSVVIPPPNITGSLHMGHALNTTIQDIIVRWKRMSGFNTLWLPGTDHAGIATQNVVEREIASEGSSRNQYGRKKFIEKVWKWREQYGRTIVYQLKRLGVSCDWSRERFTMDEGMSAAVREVFVRLYEEGLICRDSYIINWCPRCMTALSDLEVEHESLQGKLYHVRYNLTDGSGFLIVATTRPETIPGDTAVAVNPGDDRYRDFIGKTLVLPVIGREIPVIADDAVDMEFGTGALKITPAHDPNDFEVGNRHGLPRIKVMDDDGVMNDEAGPYSGMDRIKCRSSILKDMSDSESLIKEEDYTHAVGHCYRCKTIIEPNISKQWFVRMKTLAAPAIKAAEDGTVRFIPKGWENTYFEWMNNIKDWCISRQIWWGHQIPAWYCNVCEGVTVSRTDPSSCQHCGSTDICQDGDVLDTWFSSALWPFSTLGWPNETEDLKRYYPTSVLVTGFDILFFWVARMMMMGLKFMGEVPFRDVCIHALVRDAEGQKMSKSRGNVIDPLIIMDKYGTDALRFTLASMASPGRDIKLSEERIEGYRNFGNKVWNAARFIFMHMQEDACIIIDRTSLTLPDKWILSRLNSTVKDVTVMLDEYRFDLAAGTVYSFFWREFCDWYVEFAKIQLQEGDKSRENTVAVLVHTLDSALRMLHPFMPFITEEIWHQLHSSSIMSAQYPTAEDAMIDKTVESQTDAVMDIIKNIRSLRSELNIPPSREVEVCMKIENAALRGLIDGQMSYIKRLSSAGSAITGADLKRPELSAIMVFAGGEIYIPLAGIIDIDKEKGGMERKLKNINDEIFRIENKLSNQSFIEKAPQEIVRKEKEKHKELMDQKERITSNIAWLK